MVNSYKELKSFLESLTERPKLLLHSCCAPCSTHVIMLLKKYFDITVFYSNDNIFPKEEFIKRLNEEIKFCQSQEINVIFDEYNEEDYLFAIKGYETLGEKSLRCYECYKLRLLKTVMKAKQLGFDYFTTTLSISPHKNSKWINEIGMELEDTYRVKFLYSDFKKEEGYKNSVKLAKDYDLYRQDYCGCRYSLNERSLSHGKN